MSISNIIIRTHDNGIVEIQFNTTNKWVEYHRISAYLYRIDDVEIDLEKQLTGVLPKNCLIYNTQEKSQISYLYIPYGLMRSYDLKSIDLTEVKITKYTTEE